MANEIPVSVSVDDGTITIRVPLSLLRGRSRRISHTAKHPDWTILNKTRGMWRHRRVDGLTYQRHIRSEWNDHDSSCVRGGRSADGEHDEYNC